MRAKLVHLLQHWSDDLYDVYFDGLAFWELVNDCVECLPDHFEKWKSVGPLNRIVEPEDQGVYQSVEFKIDHRPR